MISTKHWPSPFENTPSFDADGHLEHLSLDEEDQRIATQFDPGIVPEEVG